uniref:Uncharacterized protein MANES_06G047000 n=1 Tax=Rhizophora mucronata TaxID=61149 RepID=A0A2P2PZV1_RHIMU
MSSENIVSYSKDSSDNDKLLDNELSKAFPPEAESELGTSIADELLRTEEDLAAKFEDCS